MKKIIIALLLFASIPQGFAIAQPLVYEYARCAGILILAISMTQKSEPDKLKIYTRDLNSLEKNAKKLKRYDEEEYSAMRFNSTVEYLDMIKAGRTSMAIFDADISYCQSMAR